MDFFKIFIYVILGFLTFGLFWIIAYWITDIFFLLYSNEEDIYRSDYILIYDKYDKSSLVKIY